ncbi:MAG: phosphatase PAP2/dual specificity phosphatase family protein [Acidobacteriota bacterium]|nr:phosphatase PAP2/dual specificity phosphatase family protein [Acidobacteriota bacterium]
MTERPWRRAIAWLLFLGPFFFASYGFANWLASRRAHVGAIVFGWEHAIPFMAWTIVPYWSIDVLYVISIFICTIRNELNRHAQRLLTVQVVSILFFIAVPLRFSFDKPDAHGLFGALFTALGSFDKPFNQAPSLHIGLLVIIWTRFAAHVATRWRWLLHAWMVLIGLSVLTTYQHHFIDLPTGLTVGFIALWALPDDVESPLRQFALTGDRQRKRLAFAYAIGALACAGLAFLGGAWLWFFWLAAALALVATNYVALGERGFQKGASGQLSVGARGLYAPYLAAAFINSRMWTRRHRQPAEVVDGIWIGRIPGDLRNSKFASVVDLTAELSCGPFGDRFYRSVPVLDLTVPCSASLHEAAEAIEVARQRGPVLVCCALGYSRSAAAVVAWLLMTHRAETVACAMAIVRKARPAIVLKNEHCAALETFA